MGKASRLKKEHREARGARRMAEAASHLEAMKSGEVLVRTFFPRSEAQTVATTPIKMVEEALRCDDRVGLLCAKIACDMVGYCMLDFVYPDVAGFFSDGDGSIYDAAYYYGATDCLRFVCQEGSKSITQPCFRLRRGSMG